jgi:hypothetical protein
MSYIHDICIIQVTAFIRGFRTKIFTILSFFYLRCKAIGTAATPGLLCEPRVTVKMIVEKQMGCRLAGETEVLGENLSKPHFWQSQNPTWPDPGLNPGRRNVTPATNRLSYSAATILSFLSHLIFRFRCSRTIIPIKKYFEKYCLPKCVTLCSSTEVCRRFGGI